MSKDETFLARWSRRKRAGAARERGRALPLRQEDGARPIAEAAGSAPELEPAIDLSDLPPIQSIGPGSDIRAFLAPGVPADLARAALRRAWSADPAVRDFIGLSENSWDFTAPGGVPGFGSVTAEDVQRLLRHFTGDPQTEAQHPTRELRSAGAGSNPPSSIADEVKEQPDRDTEDGSSDHPHDANHIAPQHELADRKDLSPLKRPRHGSALPK